MLGALRSQNRRMAYRADTPELVHHLEYCPAMRHAPFHRGDLTAEFEPAAAAADNSLRHDGDLVPQIQFDAASVAVVTPDRAGRIGVVALRHLGCPTGQRFAADLRDGYVILSPTDDDSVMVLRDPARLTLNKSVSWHLEVCDGESLMCLVDEALQVLLVPVRRFISSRPRTARSHGHLGVDTQETRDA